MSNIWLDDAPDAVLAALGEDGEAQRGYAYAFASSDGLVRIGACSNPKVTLRRAINDLKRQPGVTFTRCVLSQPHREQWKVEFQLHNRFAPSRQFGTVFKAPIDEVVAVLNELVLDRG